MWVAEMSNERSTGKDSERAPSPKSHTARMVGPCREAVPLRVTLREERISCGRVGLTESEGTVRTVGGAANASRPPNANAPTKLLRKNDCTRSLRTDLRLSNYTLFTAGKRSKREDTYIFRGAVIS